MVLKVAVVFVAGGLTGSGLVALTRSADEAQPEPQAVVAAPMNQTRASTGSPVTWMEVSPSTDQHGYIQARFAVQRPFAALNPVQR